MPGWKLFNFNVFPKCLVGILLISTCSLLNVARLVVGYIQVGGETVCVLWSVSSIICKKYILVLSEEWKRASSSAALVTFILF